MHTIHLDDMPAVSVLAATPTRIAKLNASSSAKAAIILMSNLCWQPQLLGTCAPMDDASVAFQKTSIGVNN